MPPAALSRSHAGARAESVTSLGTLTRRAWKPPWRGSASSTRSRRICASGGRPSGENCHSRSKRHTSPAERQSRSLPLLEGFHAWLETESPKVLPKSDVRGAMDYTLNNWPALCRYTESGWLDIDNNEGENAVRGIALGRRELALLWKRPRRPCGGDPFQPVDVLQAS